VVKPAAGFFLRRPSAEADDTRPWRVRLHEHFVQAIRSGELPSGARLPSARQLAREWGLARGTVDEAYATLQAEGRLHRRVGRGSFVAPHPGSSTPAAPPPRREPNRATQRTLERLSTITDDPSDFPLHGQRGLALRPQVTDTSCFPLALWRRCMAEALHERMREHLSYGPAAGVPELRTAVARHLALTRGLPCDARRVLIVESAQQATALIAQVLLEPGAEVCIADPGHVSTQRFFTLMHMRTHAVPVDDQGLDVAAAQRQVARPAMVVVQPVGQYPLGVALSPARRLALLDWARTCGAWIVEHEFLGEIGLDGPQPAPLAAADRHDSVLLVGSFSSLLFPSLRLAYLVVPERLAPTFAAVRGMLGDHSPVASQIALARFIDQGHLGTHLRTLRALYAERRQALHDALVGHGLLGPRQRGPAAGINHCLKLAAATADRAVAQALAQRGVAPGVLSAHQHRRRDLNGLVLGFGNDEPAAIHAAVAELAEVLAMSGTPSSTGGRGRG
jgi:GntR family transcriptional regulator/MocR family aminotransferase